MFPSPMVVARSTIRTFSIEARDAPLEETIEPLAVEFVRNPKRQNDGRCLIGLQTVIFERLIRFDQAAFTILFERMQRVQTRACVRVPFTTM